MLRYYGSLVSTLGPKMFRVGGNFQKPQSASLWHAVLEVGALPQQTHADAAA